MLKVLFGKGKNELRRTTSGTSGNPFTQQEIHGHRPLLLPFWLIILAFGVTCVFIPLGAVCLHASSSITEMVTRYDSVCIQGLTDADKDRNILQTDESGTVCNVEMIAPATMKAPVYLFYGLEGFHQNHRRYVQSRNDKQMRGASSTGSTGYCAPQQYLEGNVSLPIVPCGLVAWSLFNDTYQVTANGALLDIDETGISWSQDRAHKYAALESQNFQTITALRGGGSINTTLNQDEHFEVWMRPAALPNFRKLWGKINHNIPKGTLLSILIENRYNTYAFGGRKYVILSSISWLGGKNSFLGIAYIVVGGASIVFSAVLTLLQSLSGRKPGDLSGLSWKKPKVAEPAFAFGDGYPARPPFAQF